MRLWCARSETVRMRPEGDDLDVGDLHVGVLLRILERASRHAADELLLHQHQEDQHRRCHHGCSGADHVERYTHRRHLAYQSNCGSVFTLCSTMMEAKPYSPQKAMKPSIATVR